MKKILALLFCTGAAIGLVAQHTADSFKTYEQKVPGADLYFKMVPVKAGVFLMGSNDKEKNRNSDEGPQKQVSISACWVAAFEVSRDAFDVFYKDETTPQNTVDAVTRPSQQYIDFSMGMGKEGGYPVNSLSQYAALMYCRWLYNATGIFYRLPTEAEWEYACRAGATTAYYFGDDETELGKYAWFAANSNAKFQKAGQKLPNAWGLYDMLGNVSEWTLDHYDEKILEKITDKQADPFAPLVTARYPKVLKGGNYADAASQLRVAGRLKSDPVWNRRDPQIPRSKWWITDAPFVGFRVLRPLLQPTKEQATAFYTKYLGQ
ncbi:MAG: SUMF1/EgtB/PvdO family nonheme iron enzyme [Chitinophagaceae bacterium]